MATTRIEMDNEEVLTLAATVATCILMGLEQHLPPHSALGSRIKKVEDAIAGLAGLNAKRLQPEMLDLGTKAWGHAMQYVGNNIKGKAQNND